MVDQSVPQPGFAVNHTVAGSGARTVVLLHPFADNLATWQRIVPVLAAHHRVIAFDLPGFGESPRRPGPILDACVSAVHQVLEECEVCGPVTLVGNSLGATTALLFAHAHPDRVERLSLIGMPGTGGIPRRWRLLTSPPATELAAVAATVVPATVSRRVIRRIYELGGASRLQRLDPGAADSLLRHYPDRASVAALARSLREVLTAMHRLPVVDLVDAVPVPVQLVWGGRDLLVSARHARRYQASAERAVVVLPGAGHAPQVASSEQLLGVLVPFLAEGAVAAAPRAETA